MTFKWVYSSREDNFTFSEEFDTKEDAFEFAVGELGLQPGDYAYVGMKVPCLASDFLHADPFIDVVIDYMKESSYEELCDFTDSWLSDLTEDQKADLAASLHSAVDSWATKHKKQPEFFTVIDVDCIVYDPEEDDEVENDAPTQIPDETTS
jgi:hypothetical protein